MTQNIQHLNHIQKEHIKSQENDEREQYLLYILKEDDEKTK